MRAMSLTTSAGIFPTHLDKASTLTGLMTWSVDLSTLTTTESRKLPVQIQDPRFEPQMAHMDLNMYNSVWTDIHSVRELVWSLTCFPVLLKNNWISNIRKTTLKLIPRLKSSNTFSCLQIQIGTLKTKACFFWWLFLIFRMYCVSLPSAVQLLHPYISCLTLYLNMANHFYLIHLLCNWIFTLCE